MEASKQTHVIVMTTAPGYWGKGETVEEALAKAEWIRAKDKVRVVKCGPEARITEMGSIEYDKDVGYSIVGEGVVMRGGKKVALS